MGRTHPRTSTFGTSTSSHVHQRLPRRKRRQIKRRDIKRSQLKTRDKQRKDRKTNIDTAHPARVRQTPADVYGTCHRMSTTLAIGCLQHLPSDAHHSLPSDVYNTFHRMSTTLSIRCLRHFTSDVTTLSVGCLRHFPSDVTTFNPSNTLFATVVCWKVFATVGRGNLKHR